MSDEKPSAEGIVQFFVGEYCEPSEWASVAGRMLKQIQAAEAAARAEGEREGRRRAFEECVALLVPLRSTRDSEFTSINALLDVVKEEIEMLAAREEKPLPEGEEGG